MGEVLAMGIQNRFRSCPHNTQPKEVDPVTGAEVTAPLRMKLDWRDCYQCVDEVTMQLAIARSYLKELATADFNDNGVCVKPIAEPIQGRDYQSIAATGFGACSD